MASKNQRSGLKQEQKPHLCPKGHAQIVVLFAGEGFKWVCDCDDYIPIDVSKPYQSRKAKIKVGGQSRIWFEYPEVSKS